MVDPAHAAPSGTRYRGELVTVRDEIRNGAEETEIEVARLAPRLILPGEEATGYTLLPVAQISGLNAEGGVVISESFLPPALMISAVPGMFSFSRKYLRVRIMCVTPMPEWWWAEPGLRWKIC